MTDQPQARRDQPVAAFLRQFSIGLSAYRLFPDDLTQPGFVAAAERIRAAAEAVLPTGPLEMDIRGREFSQGQDAVPGDEFTERLALACYERGVERLRVTTPPNPRELAVVYTALSMTPGEVEAAGGLPVLLDRAAVTGLSLGKVEPVASDEKDGSSTDGVWGKGRGRFYGRMHHPAAVALDGLVGESDGSPREQAEKAFDHLVTLVSSLPQQLSAELDLTRRLHEVVDHLPPDVRNQFIALALERFGEDSFATRLVNSMSDEGLARALVELGKDGSHDPAELARSFAAAGARREGLVELTMAVINGEEEAGTIIPGLARLSADADRESEEARSRVEETLSDLLSRELMEMEIEDTRRIREEFPRTAEDVRPLSLAALRDYARLEHDLLRLEAVLGVWALGVREAVLERDNPQLVDVLAPVGAAISAAGSDASRTSALERARRTVLDRPLLADLFARSEDGGVEVAAVLEPFGDTAVDALFELLAEEQDPGIRAALLGVLRRLAASHQRTVARRLSDHRWYVVRNAVHVLGRSGGPGVTSLLADASRHPSEVVRRETVWALASAAGPSAVPHLLRMEADPHRNVREAAARAILGLLDEASAPALADVVRTSHHLEHRKRAIDVLASRDAPEATEILRQLASRRGQPRLPRALRRHARVQARARERR